MHSEFITFSVLTCSFLVSYYNVIIPLTVCRLCTCFPLALRKRMLTVKTSLWFHVKCSIICHTTLEMGTSSFLPSILHSIPFLEKRWVPRCVCGIFSPVEIDLGSTLDHSCYLKCLWTLLTISSSQKSNIRYNE